MFVFLLCFLLNIELTFSSIIIQGSGVYEIEVDDIAMVLYLTVENTYDRPVHLSVSGIKCSENGPYEQPLDHMLLIGGDMPNIRRKTTSNITLIYPNLFLANRIGSCLVSLHYDNEDAIDEIRHEINFRTPNCLKRCKAFCGQGCTTPDLVDAGGLCSATDCQIKYSAKRGYFNKEFKMCQLVPECPPNNVYNPKSNTCRKLFSPVCQSDLEILEDGHYEKCQGINNLVTFTCHNGMLDKMTGECVCDDNWITFTCDEGPYHPTLDVYHMCNIGLNNWGRAYKEKLIMTIIAIVIFALAIAAKMLIAVCILNWCCHFIKSRKESYCTFESCPNLHDICQDSNCPERESAQQVRSSRTVRVSFSDVDGMSTCEETDATLSLEGSDLEHHGPCHCCKK